MISSGKKLVHTFFNIFRREAVNQELIAGSNQDICSSSKGAKKGDKILQEELGKKRDEAINVPSVKPAMEVEQVAPSAGAAEINHSDSLEGGCSDRRCPEAEVAPPNAKANTSPNPEKMPVTGPAEGSVLANLLSNLEDFYKNNPSCIIPEKDKGCSRQELDTILKHGELFFVASPKRFVLKKWITDEIRRMFDARERAPLSVSEIYDSLLELFRTGFFSLPNLHDFLGALRVLTWDDFVNIENKVMNDYNLAISGQANEVGTSKSAYETMPINALGLSTCARNCLRRNGIVTVGQLLVMSEESLLKLWGLGRTSLNEIKLALKEMGLCLQKGVSNSSCHERGRLEKQPLSTKQEQHTEEEIDVMAAIFASFDFPTKDPDVEV